MFQRLAGNPDNLSHLRRIESAVRARFALEDGALVLVREDASRQPGFPSCDTVVRFWHVGQRYRLRVFRPAAQVTEADLPPAFLLPSLIDDGDPDCC